MVSMTGLATERSKLIAECLTFGAAIEGPESEVVAKSFDQPVDLLGRVNLLMRHWRWTIEISVSVDASGGCVELFHGISAPGGGPPWNWMW